MQRHEIQVEATVVFNLSVDAESLDATKEQIQEALEDDLKRINNAIFHQCVSDVYKRRAELKDWEIRNYIAYVPKVISRDEGYALWDRLTGDTADEPMEEDEEDEDYE